MSVLEAIKKQQLRSIKRGIVSSEIQESVTRANAEHVKVVLSGEADDIDETKMAGIYARLRTQYDGKPHVGKPLTKRSKSFWGRVLVKQKESGVSPEKFMTAQFDWFHKNFGKIPEVFQLATDAAVTRAREYAGSENKRIASTAREANVNFAELMKQSDKMMRDICAAQGMTRLEVYTKLVIPGHFAFPKQYLESDPVYKQALEGK